MPNTSVLGSGTYFSAKEDTIYAFGGGVQVRATYADNAKVGKIGDIHILRQKLLGDKELTQEAQKLISDYGTLAALLGYDAIENPTTIVAMNRKALLIEDIK
jgi:hypothetical protein